jgi:hypothetical protein
MSRREIKTEGGDTILLPGRKQKLCACGQPTTRYCDFPRYQSLGSILDSINSCEASPIVCAEPLCDRCVVEQPNGKDFCRRHAEQIKEMIESANKYKQGEI